MEVGIFVEKLDDRLCEFVLMITTLDDLTILELLAMEDGNSENVDVGMAVGLGFASAIPIF